MSIFDLLALFLGARFGAPGFGAATFVGDFRSALSFL